VRPLGHLSLALLGAAVACVVALHIIRPRVSPIERRLSEYALGPYGWLMDTAFATAAAGLTALAVLLARTAGRPRFVPAALVVAALALVLSAVYRLGEPGNRSDVIHRWASGTAGAAVIAAGVGWSILGAGRRRPWRRGTELPLVGLALALAVLSPVLHETFLTGINQRLVWATLIAWSVVVTITELVAVQESRR
jgi:Protein of unknown function (DUF998)